MKVLVTGGARSGKTRYALAAAESLGPRRIYLATAEPRDAEMVDRIALHRAERGPSWSTIEEPLEIAARLDQDAVVLVDCLTLWVSNLLEARGEDADLEPDFARLAEALRAAPNPLVFVTSEVGMGIVPMNRLARVFRDHAGRLGQRISSECDRVVLTALGLPLVLK